MFRSAAMKGLLRAPFVVLLLQLLLAMPAQAEIFTPGDRLMLQAGPYVMHWSESTKHNAWPMLLGAEWENAERWEVGGAVFKNSFYQPCVYLYGAKRWFLPAVSENLYLKLSGGPLYGYKDEYESKVPFNHRGLGFAILPALGYQYGRANAQAVFLGTAAIIFTFGYDFN